MKSWQQVSIQLIRGATCLTHEQSGDLITPDNTAFSSLPLTLSLHQNTSVKRKNEKKKKLLSPPSLTTCIPCTCLNGTVVPHVNNKQYCNFVPSQPHDLHPMCLSGMNVPHTNLWRTESLGSRAIVDLLIMLFGVCGVSNSLSCSICGGERCIMSSPLVPPLGGVSCPKDRDAGVQWGDELSGDLILNGLPSNEEGDTSLCCLGGGEKEGESMESMDGR